MLFLFLHRLVLLLLLVRCSCAFRNETINTSQIARIYVEALSNAAKLGEESLVDNPCQSNERGGNDPCACPIRCRDLRCTNAKEFCKKSEWCHEIETNTAKRLPNLIATLKRRDQCGQ